MNPCPKSEFYLRVAYLNVFQYAHFVFGFYCMPCASLDAIMPPESVFVEAENGNLGFTSCRGKLRMRFYFFCLRILQNTTLRVQLQQIFMQFVRFPQSWSWLHCPVIARVT